MRASIGILLVTAAVTVAGCANDDPCAGKSGVCIGVQVEGNATGLDQLALTVGDPAKTLLSPTAPRPFTLPARLALLMPAGTSGTVHVACDGMAQGQPIAHDETDAQVTGGHAQITLRLDPGTVGSDGGNGDGGGDVDFAGADLSACATVTACMDGDGCCPAGCNNGSDHDCPSVCGNGSVESGEVCDDHNLTNGDACDPTCKWANVMTTLSGVPGSQGYADGPDSRFGNFTGMTTDGTNVYVSDNTASVVRTTPVINPVGSTLFAGVPYDSRLVDGASAIGRLAIGGGNGDMVTLGGTLYIVNFSSTLSQNVLRSVTATTFGTIPSTAVSQPQNLATDGTVVYFTDGTGGLSKWTPGGSSSTTIATAAQIMTALGSSPFFTGMTYYSGALYLSVFHGIVKITTAGVVSLFTGSLDASKSGCTNGTPSAATWGQLGHLTNDGGGNLYIPDTGCCAIRTVSLGGGSTVTTYAGVLGSCGYVDGVAQTSMKLSSPTDFLYRVGGGSSFVLDNGNSVVRILPTVGNVHSIGSPPSIHATTVFGSAASARYSSVLAVTSDGTKLYAVGGNAPSLFTVALADGTSADLGGTWTGATAVVKIGAKLYIGLDNGTIHTTDLTGANDTIVVGTAGATYPPSDGTPGSPLSAVVNPTAFATDGTDLYFLDKANLVRKLAVAAATVTTIAGTQSSTDIVDGVGGGAHFAGPRGLAFVGGTLYTLDGVNNPNMGFVAPITVRRIVVSSRDVKTIAGQVSTLGDADGVGLAAQFSGAVYLATDGLSLFISDADGDFSVLAKGFQPTIRQMTLADNSVTTMIGTRNERTIHNATGTQAFVNQPGPIVFDPATHALIWFDRAEGVFQRLR